MTDDSQPQPQPQHDTDTTPEPARDERDDEREQPKRTRRTRSNLLTTSKTPTEAERKIPQPDPRQEITRIFFQLPQNLVDRINLIITRNRELGRIPRTQRDFVAKAVAEKIKREEQKALRERDSTRNYQELADVRIKRGPMPTKTLEQRRYDRANPKYWGFRDDRTNRQQAQPLTNGVEPITNPADHAADADHDDDHAEHDGQNEQQPPKRKKRDKIDEKYPGL